MLKGTKIWITRKTVYDQNKREIIGCILGVYENREDAIGSIVDRYEGLDTCSWKDNTWFTKRELTNGIYDVMYEVEEHIID